MATSSDETISSDLEVENVKEEVDLKLKLFMVAFFIIFSISFLIPGVIFVYYLIQFFVPLVLEAGSIFTVFSNIQSILALMFMPFVMIVCYFIHLFLVALVTRWLWGITERISPSKEGMIPLNRPSKTLDYYHIRSFMIKYPKNVYVKGPFPWLANWLFNFVGTNKIGKGTTIEEQVCGDKFCEVGNNCYLGVNSVLTTHLVEGIFGRVSYFKIKLDDNVTFTAQGCIAPGGELKDNSYLLPYASAFKFSKLQGNNYYFGIPLRKIFKKKTMEYLGLSKEDLERDKELRMKQQQLKKELKTED